MRKFIDLAKKPLLFACAGLFVIFTVMLIIVCCVPHGKTYSYETANDEEIDFVFKGDKLLEQKGSSYTEYNYKINKDIVYVQWDESGEYEKLGEINSFEIVVKEGNSTLIMECETNKDLRTLSIVMMVLTGLGTIGCVTLLILDKKGVFNKKEQQEVVAE